MYAGKIIAGTGAEGEIIMQVNEDGSFFFFSFSENTYAMSQSKCQHYQWIQVSEAKPVKNSAKIVGSKKGMLSPGIFCSLSVQGLPYGKVYEDLH